VSSKNSNLACPTAEPAAIIRRHDWQIDRILSGNTSLAITVVSAPQRVPHWILDIEVRLRHRVCIPEEILVGMRDI